MRRREFIAGLAGAALLRPLQARAAVPVIGFLHSQTAELTAPRLKLFHAGLREAGYVEGTSVLLEYRWADGNYGRLPELAADLVRHRVDLIAAIANNAVIAARAATQTIPIVAMMGGDLVGMGWVKSLSRPGGNLTGLNLFVPGTSDEKRLELLHELVPSVAEIGILHNPTLDTYAAEVVGLNNAATKLGVTLRYFLASSPAEIDVAFAAMARAGVRALLVAVDPSLEGWRFQIGPLTRRHRIATMDSGRPAVEAGSLMSYGVDILAGYRQVALYVGRVLSGEKPADLPILQATKFEFVVNLQTARAIGLDVPANLLALADTVIE